MGLGLQAQPCRVVGHGGLLVLTFIFIVALSATAQAPPSQSTPPQAPSPAEPFRDYIIGPQDLLSITILESPELSRETRVGPDGTVGLPLLDRVLLRGLTLTEAEDVLEKKYIEAGILNSPHITVTVLDLQSKPVTVLGAVRSPGVFQVSGQSRLLRILSQAGGTTAEAGGIIRIIRADAQGAEQVLDVPMSEVLGGALESNVPIYGGDTVNVVPAGAVYVVGAVNAPGRHVLAGEGEKAGILQVVAMAHDLTRTAKSDKAVLIRKDEKGELKQIPVNIGKILRQQAPDVVVYANDVLYVPDSTSKRAFTRGLAAALQVATGLALISIR
jgi:polysaccharide export outer membrane protein